MTSLQKVAELFARLEADRVSRRDLHFHSSFRVAPDALLPLLHLEDAETPQLDALSPSECVAKPLDHGVDRLGRLHARNFRNLCDFVDDIGLDHLTSGKTYGL